MPILKDEDRLPYQFRDAGGFDVPEPKPGPGVDEVVWAAARQENDIVNAVRQMSRDNHYPYDPNYNPVNDPTFNGTKYLDEYGDKFVRVRNRDEALAIKQRIDGELKDAETLESAGIWGQVTGMVSGILSPTNLFPGGEIYRGIRAGQRAVRSARSVGVAAGAATAVQEGILQSAQETRTPQESVANIAGAVLLGGIIGGAAGTFSGRVADKMGDDLAGITPRPDTHVVVPGVGRINETPEAAGVARAAMDEVPGLRPEGRPADAATEPSVARGEGVSREGSTLPEGAEPRGFTTAKGSTYELGENGVTTRNKAARADVGHEGDSGPQPTSEKTVYVDPQNAQRLATPSGDFRVVDHGDGTLSIATPRPDGNGYGVSPDARGVQVTTSPQVGYMPVELWKGEKINGRDAYAQVHFGNEIVSVDRAPPTGGAGGSLSAGVPAGVDTRLKPTIIDPVIEPVTKAIKQGVQGISNVVRRTFGADPNLKPVQGSGIADVSAFMTPLQRGQTSESGAMRKATAMLADPAGMRFRANTPEGEYSPLVPGGSVEVRSHVEVDSMMANYQQRINEIYMNYWQSVAGVEGVRGKIGIAMNAAKQATIGGDGPLSPSQFFEMVGRAIRVDDAASISDPFVKEAAATFKNFVSQVVERMPEELRPDVSGGPRFAGGYVPRIFNVKAIAAKATEFQEIIFRNMKLDQERKAMLQGEAVTAKEEMTAAQIRERKLQGRQETAQRRLSDVESRLAEIGMVSRKGQARLEAADIPVARLERDISALEGEVAAAKETRDYNANDLKNIQDELTALRKERDEALRQSEKQPGKEPVSYDEIRQPPDMKMFLDYVTGKKGKPRVPTFLNWVISQGGVKHDGDIMDAFGGKPPKGLFKPDGRSLDDLGRAYADHVGVSNESDIGYRFEVDEMRDMIRNAVNGEEPADWRNSYSDDLRQRVELHEMAQQSVSELERAGIDPTNRAGVISYLKNESPDDLPGKPAGPDDFEDIPLDPVENYKGMDELAAGVQGNVRESQKLIDHLRKKISAREKPAARAEGRQGEALANAKSARSRLDALLERAEIYARVDSNLAAELKALESEKVGIRGKLEKVIKEWEGATTKAARKSIERVEQQAAERQKLIEGGEYKGRGERLTGADQDVDKAINQITRSDRNLSDAELRTRAREITMNMMASPEGRLPYEWGETAAKQSRAAGAMREEKKIPFLEERKFPVPDSEMLEFLHNDIRQVGHAYVHSMIPQGEMQRMFGDVSGTSVLRDIQEDYGRKVADIENMPHIVELRARGDHAAANRAAEAEGLALQSQMNKDIQTFETMRDRVLGVFGLPENPDGFFHRAASVARSMQYLSKMGMMVVSSSADAGMVIARNGVGSTLDALGGVLARGSKDAAIAEQAAIEKTILMDSGIGLEYLLGSRAMSFSEIATDYGRGSKFERALEGATAGFSYMNLSRQFDTAMQSIAGVAGLRRIMRNAEAWADGTITPGEAEWMASINLGPDQARRIWRAAQAGDGERIQGAFIPDGRSWADSEAYDAVRYALRQHVDSTIIKPGQDKPGWMSTPIGKVIGQFRTFTISANQRILISGLQQADANMAQGVVSMIALGMTSVALSDLIRDGKLKERTPGEWFVEGGDRSGLGGWFMEVNNVAEKISGQNFGLRPMAGQQPAARSINQSKADAILGPSLGFVSDMTRVIGAGLTSVSDLSKEEGDKTGLTRGDVRAVRNQIPLQNLFWMRFVFNAVQENFEKVLGIYEPPKKQ